MLGTTLQQDPYHESGNYGPTAEDRPLVFNTSYSYNSGTLHTGSALLNAVGGGWTVSGISTWQKGGYIPAIGYGELRSGPAVHRLAGECGGQGITRHRRPDILRYG